MNNIKTKLKKHWVKAGILSLLFAISAGIAILPFSSDVTRIADNHSYFVDIAYAQDLKSGGAGLAIPEKKDGVQISSTISKKSFGDTLLSMVNYFIGFLGFLATLAFVYAGVLWVLSGGSEEMITKSRKIMIYAGLGMIVVILSYSAVTFIAGSGGGVGVMEGSLAKDQPCTLITDCGPDLTCAFNNDKKEWMCMVYAAKGDNCKFDTQCATGFCDAGLCKDRPKCVSDAQCLPIYNCVDGECQSAEVIASYGKGGLNCKEDDVECPTGFKCNLTTGECESSAKPFFEKGPDQVTHLCNSDLDCVGNQECLFDPSKFQRSCADPDVWQGSRCADANDCVNPKIYSCINQVCKLKPYTLFSSLPIKTGHECKNDNECKIKGTNYVCRSALNKNIGVYVNQCISAVGRCEINSDCNPGFECVLSGGLLQCVPDNTQAPQQTQHQCYSNAGCLEASCKNDICALSDGSLTNITCSVDTDCYALVCRYNKNTKNNICTSDDLDLIRCADNPDCPDGYICNTTTNKCDSVKRTKQDFLPDRTKEGCQSDADCTEIQCLSDKCQYKGSKNIFLDTVVCSNDQQSENYGICTILDCRYDPDKDKNVCIKPLDPFQTVHDCGYDDPCGVGEICKLNAKTGINECVKKDELDWFCSIDADCNTIKKGVKGGECENNVCVKEFKFLHECGGIAGSCEPTNDGKNQVCKLGKDGINYCDPVGMPEGYCSSDSDCEADAVCNEFNMCQIDYNPGHLCGDFMNKSCPAGERCVFNIGEKINECVSETEVKYVCEKDSDCNKWATGLNCNEYGICQKEYDPGHKCLGSLKPCPEGQMCVLDLNQKINVCKDIPPVPGICAEDDDCGAGFECSEYNMCFVPFSEDHTCGPDIEDCPENEICRFNISKGFNECTERGKIPGSCDSTADCEDGLVCEVNMCIVPYISNHKCGPGLVACSADQVCAFNGSFNECVDKDRIPGTCSVTSDCTDEGTVCTLGACVRPYVVGHTCGGDFPVCPSGEICAFNADKKINECMDEQKMKGICSEDSDCTAPGNTCEIGICVVTYSPAHECLGDRLLCEGNDICIYDIKAKINKCVDKAPVFGVCTESADCGEGMVCNQYNICEFRYETGHECGRFLPECPSGEWCSLDMKAGVNMCIKREEAENVCDTDDDCDAPGTFCTQYHQCQYDYNPGHECLADVLPCPGGQICLFNQKFGVNQCADPDEIEGVCSNDDDCEGEGVVCNKYNRCELDYKTDNECGGRLGRCPGGGICAYDEAKDANVCKEPSEVGGEGFCVNDGQCGAGQICGADNFCIVDSDIEGTDRSSDAESVAAGHTGLIDDALKNLADDLDVSDFINVLPDEAKRLMEQATSTGMALKDRMDIVKGLIANADELGLTSSEVRELKKFLSALERLQLIRSSLKELRDSMPESEDTIAKYDDALASLDELMEDPAKTVFIRRFDGDYKELKLLIDRFPVVKSVIEAAPIEDNVPFTVLLNGLNSIDPTGGTITDYEWTYSAPDGSPVLIGSDPVVTYEFTEPNTYVIRLRVGTSQRDSQGYKTASDGMSTIRVKAKPSASDVKFRINGIDVTDIFHVTLKEAQAGVSFDPTPTVPALGRMIEKYEWFFGDTITEARSVPSTVVHTYPKADEYFIKLETTDNVGEKDKFIVKLFVKTLAADVKINPPEGNVNTEFVFDGTNSRSDDGLITDFEWEIQAPDGSAVFETDQPVFRERFKEPGKYAVILTVTDITGSTDKGVFELNITSRSPIANFDYQIPEKNHPNRVVFNGVSSYDLDEGDIINYSWDFDGDGTFEITNSNEALAVHEYIKAGEYRAKLQVQDYFGKRDMVEKKVSVKSILAADISSDKRATRVDEPVELTAVSDEAVGFLWEFGDGETQSTEEKIVTHTYNRTGRFKVRLTYFDEEDNENSATKNILVGANDKPVAAINLSVSGMEPRVVEDLCGIGKDGAVVTRTDLIRFDAKDSINMQGDTRFASGNYNWSLYGGEKRTSKEFTYKFDEINRGDDCSEFSLIVRDSGALSDPDTVYFRVENELPQITDFVIDLPLGEELITPTKVKLRVVNPKDTDGAIKKYKWWFYREGYESEKYGVHNTSNPETEMIITSFGEPDIMNRYFFVVELTDNDNGTIDSKERFGEVSFLDIKNGPNLSPVAEFSVDKTTISVGDSITFVSRSYDPQGDTLPMSAFKWDFDGDGEFDDTTSGPQVNRQYNTPGEYSARLKVTHRGLSSSYTKKVYVEQTDALPQAAFTYKINDNTVIFDGGLSRYDPSLMDITLRYEWDFDTRIDANGNGIKDDDVEATEKSPIYTYDEKGLYKVRLKVKDSLGMEGVVVREVNLAETEKERQEKAYDSLKVTAPKHPITTLDIKAVPAILDKGGSSEIIARVLNADGSLYAGKVFFEVMEGSGEFAPNPVIAKDSRAIAIFNSIDKGNTRIKVRATETMHGELEEEATIIIK